MISLPLTGWMVREHGWPTPFYIFGAVGLVWGAAWFMRVPEGRAIDDGFMFAFEPFPTVVNLAQIDPVFQEMGEGMSLLG